MKNSIIDQSIIDLSQNCDALIYLTHDAHDKLLRLTHDEHFFSDPALEIKKILLNSYTEIAHDLDIISTRLHHDSLSENDIKEQHQTIQQQEEKLRTLQGILGNCITSSDWQSPSFAASLDHQAGRQTGTITMGVNDYKRDLHADGIAYEQSFRKAYISSFPLSFVKVYATNSGMSAFATIIGFLQGEKKCTGPIIVGKSSYFESKNLLYSFFGDQILEVDEHDVPQIKHLIQTKKPSAVFFDSSCSSPDVALPNIPAIVDIIRNQKRKDLLLIIDNTGLSISIQPLASKRLYDPYVQIIVWESLLKHHQFGLDRISGGIIYSSARDDNKLYDYRDHMGTNISDTAASTLPSPNRTILMKRLLLQERNTRMMSQIINDVLFPGSPTHPSYDWSNSLPYHGAILTLNIPKKHQQLWFYKKLLHNAIQNAKKAQINIIGGSSFGLSTTRLYIPASYGHQAIPFFRIAVGTEPILIFEKIIAVVKKTIEEMENIN